MISERGRPGRSRFLERLGGGPLHRFDSRRIDAGKPGKTIGEAPRCEQ